MNKATTETAQTAEPGKLGIEWLYIKEQLCKVPCAKQWSFNLIAVPIHKVSYYREIMY